MVKQVVTKVVLILTFNATVQSGSYLNSDHRSHAFFANYFPKTVRWRALRIQRDVNFVFLSTSQISTKIYLS